MWLPKEGAHRAGGEVLRDAEGVGGAGGMVLLAQGAKQGPPQPSTHPRHKEMPLGRISCPSAGCTKQPGEGQSPSASLGSAAPSSRFHRFDSGLGSSKFTDRLLHFSSMAFLSCGRHISKYHIYQKACVETRARITLLMVPPITTTTINFSGKKTQPGTFCAEVWEQGPGPGLQISPPPASPPHPHSILAAFPPPAHLVSLVRLGLPAPRGDIFPPCL